MAKHAFMALACVLLGGEFPCAIAADEAGKAPVVAPSAAANKGTVDDQLRRQLDSDLLEGLGQVLPPEKKPAANNSPPDGEIRPPAAPTTLDEKLLNELGGEEQADPLARIGARMRQAEKLMAGQVTSERTQKLQQEIVSDLASLIHKLEQQMQCQGGQCQKPGQLGGGQQAKPAGQPQPGNTAAKAPANNPARESTPELRPHTVARAEAAVVDQTRRLAWGALPDRLRQQLQNSAGEEFLPEYTSLIEEYFERLAESLPK